MKTTVNQYAKTLYAVTKDKSQKEISSLVSNFAKILVKNNQIELFSKISEKFSEIWNKEKGIIEAEVISREELHNELRNKVSKYIKEKYRVKEVILNNVIDKKIKGGMIIKVGDEIMDESVNRRIRCLQNVLNK